MLLAFVFNEVWSEYNTAAQAINRECASLHGVAILAERLPTESRNAVLRGLQAYLVAVVDREWPDMRQRIESREAGKQFQSLWGRAATADAGISGAQVRGQILDLLADAHQNRETRLFQMTQGVPGLVWGMLVIFSGGLVGCMLVFAAEASVSKALFVGLFTSALTLALLTVHILDFPFESALQLTSQDFNFTLQMVDDLMTTAPQQVQPRSG